MQTREMFVGAMDLVNRAGRAAWLGRLVRRMAARVTRDRAAAPLIELLESRQLLANVYWEGAGDGTNWTDVANWSVGSPTGGVHALPGASDDVFVQLASNPTVRLTAGTQSVRSVTATNPLLLTGGVLALGTTLTTSANVSLQGGTVRGGVVSCLGGARLAATGTASTLDAVTVNGPVDLTAASTQVIVLNGLTLNGTATLGSASRLRFNGGSQTLGGNGTVVFNGAGVQALTAGANNMTLTIGAGITVRGGHVVNNNFSGAVIGYSSGLGGGTNTSVINLGTIIADGGASTYLQVFPNGGTFTNSGTISALNGGGLTVVGLTGAIGTATVSGSGSVLALSGANYVNSGVLTMPAGTILTLNGTWSNTGTINATSANVNLGGTFSVASVGTLNRTGGTVNITGTLTNTGTTLTLNAASGDWRLAGGTIRGGTVDAVEGAKLVATSTSSTLDAVIMNGPLDLTASSSQLTVLNGLTLNGTMTLGSSSRVRFDGGSQTLGGSGTVVFNGDGIQALIANANNMTLTIGAGITVRGGNDLNSTFSGAVVGYSSGFGGGTNTSIINLGTILADGGASTYLQIFPNGGTFTNSGTIGAVNGGGLTVAGLAGVIGATSVSGSGSALALTGTNYAINGVLTMPAGTTLTLNGTWSNTGTINAT